jgi:capsular polysaccharide transport system ATP-binding protein
MQRSDIILVTHNSRTIRQYCDRAAILADGELRLYDDVAGALAEYRRHIMKTGDTVQ